MAVPFSNTKLRVPKGFQNILEGLAREILRNQPENMFEFGSKYFDQLLKVREVRRQLGLDDKETGHDPAVHGARLEDRFYNNDSFKSPSVDPSSPQQQDAALTIQTNYRKHAAEQEVGEMREAEAAQKIQAGFRGYQDRQKFEEMKDEDQKGEDKEEVDIDLNDPDVEAAAVKIQAGFKGFKARQEIKETKEKSVISDDQSNKGQIDEEEVDIDLDDPEVGAAALKIQAGFRGFQTRKEMKDKEEKQKDAKDESSDKAEQAEAKETGEEVDLDLEDPELADAALKIQSGFRGHIARKELKAKQESKSTEQKADEPKKEEEEVDIDLEDPDVENAALKIQAGFKGMKARQEIKAMKDSKPEDETKQETAEEKTEEKKEEEVDIDLNDPETEKAALKIQAGFKGYQTRKEIKAKKEDNAQETEKASEEKSEEKAEEKTEEVDIDLNDPEVEKAATKIQAGFKGYKTRKGLKDKVEGEGDEKQEAGEGTTEGTKQEETGTEPKADAEPQTEDQAKTEGEEVDIDLNDPEVSKAATKIQAGFKGFKTRQELSKKKEESKE